MARPKLFHLFVAGLLAVIGPMFLFMMQMQHKDHLSQQNLDTVHNTESANDLEEPDTLAAEPTQKEKTLVSTAYLETALTNFYNHPYVPSFTYKCDPSGRSCICLQDWIHNPVCQDLDKVFEKAVRNPSSESRIAVRAMIEPQWEYLNRYEPGMYDCPNSICSVELANTDKFVDCIFVPLDRKSVLNFSTYERKDCSFPILDIKLPTCVEVSDPRDHLSGYGVKKGMMVVQLHGIPVMKFTDLEQAERSLSAAPRPSNVLFCNRAQVPADEEANARDVFIFSGDKINKGWEQQRPFLPQKPGTVTGLRAAVILENFERWYPTYNEYVERLGELYLNETDIILGYKPITNPRREHHWVPLYYPDVALESFRMPTIPAKDKIHAVAWFSSECSPDYAPERYRMTNKLLELLPDSLPLHSFGKCKHNMNQFDFKECNGVGFDSLLPDRDATKECILRQYKFYIAFENSEAEGYITEKLWQGLKIGSLPVYWGSPNIFDYMPKKLIPGQAPPIISVRHYDDIEAVVAYMLKLADDDDLYDQHMQWKAEPFEPGFERAVNHGRSKMFCHVCDKVAELKKLNMSPARELRV